MRFVRDETRDLFVWAHLHDQRGNHLSSTHGHLLGHDADFDDLGQNKAREQLLEQIRPNERDDLRSATFFAAVELSPHDVLAADSSWRGVGLVELAREYKRCYDQGIATTERLPLGKENQKSATEMKTRVESLTRALAQPLADWPLGVDDSNAVHHSIWFWERHARGRWYVLDGTHRLLALTCGYLLEGRPWPTLRALACGKTVPGFEP